VSLAQLEEERGGDGEEGEERGGEELGTRR
jgi:hypothetical protein